MDGTLKRNQKNEFGLKAERHLHRSLLDYLDLHSIDQNGSHNIHLNFFNSQT
jgi:hypothetical protein